MKKMNTKGFTIIELLIATVTFALILLIITAAIIQFSKVYYKGVATSKTQEVARSIADDMSRAAQFSTSFNGSSPGVYCFGDKRYSFNIDTITQPVLIADVSASCTKKLSLVPATDRELIGENMKLLRLSAIEVGDTITIEVTVAFGDAPTAISPTCPLISVGGQFCAVSTIQSTVTRRL